MHGLHGSLPIDIHTHKPQTTKQTAVRDQSPSLKIQKDSAQLTTQICYTVIRYSML